jgi:hypothetical protein
VPALAKPLGVFDPGPDPPAWASLGVIHDILTDAELTQCLRLSHERGMKWILFLGGRVPHNVPIGPHAAQVRARFEALGLMPWVVAYMYHEEWYEHFLEGTFTRYGYPPDYPNGIELVCGWVGRQHKAATAELGVPAVWVTNMVNTDPSLGRGHYRPVPAHTQYVAIDAYVGPGRPFDSIVPVLAHAETTTPLPLILIPQWFRFPSVPFFARGASVEDMEQFMLWLDRPRWVAAIGYTWSSGGHVGAEMIGLDQLPALRAVVESYAEGKR